MSEVLVQITAPHLCAAVIAQHPHPAHDRPVVAWAAPILRYMVGWTGEQVRDYCIRKGWTWQVVAPFTPRE